MKKNKTIFAFCHIEKCAGSTLIYLLRRNFGLGHCDIIPMDRHLDLAMPQDLRFANSIHPALKSVAGHSVRPCNALSTEGVKVVMYTCLRDPVKRFISDYKYDVHTRGYPFNICEFLEVEDRCNFQCKALAGCADLDIAKEMLENRIDLIGFTEHYDDFITALSRMMQKYGYYMPVNYEIRNTSNNNAQKTKHEYQKISEQDIELIREKNALDIQLYEWAHKKFYNSQNSVEGSSTQKQQAVEAPSEKKQRMNLFSNRAFRNFIYKPSRLRMPISVHRLARNSKHSGNF